MLAEIVDELALALVAPLRADCGERSADVRSDGREMEAPELSLVSVYTLLNMYNLAI